MLVQKTGIFHLFFTVPFSKRLELQDQRPIIPTGYFLAMVVRLAPKRGGANPETFERVNRNKPCESKNHIVYHQIQRNFSNLFYLLSSFDFEFRKLVINGIKRGAGVFFKKIELSIKRFCRQIR